MLILLSKRLNCSAGAKNRKKNIPLSLFFWLKNLNKGEYVKIHFEYQSTFRYPAPNQSNGHLKPDIGSIIGKFH